MDVTIEDRRGVYYPREDSQLLARVVEERAEGDTLDLGTGSGIQGIVAAKKGCRVTFADIQKSAVEAARANAESNGVTGRFVMSDLFSKIDGTFDTIIFNPPYLPSVQTEEIALDGGRGGREVIARFLKCYKSHLRQGVGRFCWRVHSADMRRR